MSYSISVTAPTNVPSGEKGKDESHKERTIREGTHEYLDANSTALQYKNTFLHVGESNADGLRRIATCPTWQVPVESETPTPEPEHQIITYLPTTSAGGTSLKGSSKQMIRNWATVLQAAPYEIAHHTSVQASHTSPSLKKHFSDMQRSTHTQQESTECNTRGVRLPSDLSNDTHWSNPPTAHAGTSKWADSTDSTNSSTHASDRVYRPPHQTRAGNDASAINTTQQSRGSLNVSNKWGKGGWGKKTSSWEDNWWPQSAHVTSNLKWDPAYQSASSGDKSRWDESYPKGPQNWFVEGTRPLARANDVRHWSVGSIPQQKGKKGPGKGQSKKRTTQFKPPPKGPKAVYIDLSKLTVKENVRSIN